MISLIAVLGIFSCGQGLDVWGQSSSLFFKKCKANEGLCNTQEIVRLDFAGGQLIDRKLVFSVETSEARFDLGSSRLFNKNLLVGSFGDVVDLKKQKLLFKSNGSLLGIFGRKVLVDVDNVKDDDLYTFDLDTHSTRRYKSNESLEELEYYEFSPNGSHFATWSFGDGFQFYSINRDLKVKRIGSSKQHATAECSLRCSSALKVPLIWTDESHILTQTANGKLLTISIDGKVERIIDLNIDEIPDSLPHFSKDTFGNLFYYAGGTFYLIDLTNKAFKTDRLPLGYSFARNDGEAFSSEYFFANESIGTIWSGESVSSKNYLAVVYAAEGKNLGYPDGIKVWNTISRKWITLEEPWSVSLIGWVEN